MEGDKMTLLEVFSNITDFETYVKSCFATSKNLDLVRDNTDVYAKVVAYAVYTFYKRNDIAYETADIFKEHFEYDLCYAMMKNYQYFVYQKELYLSNKMNDKGSVNTNRDVSLNQTTGSFTKQANTPSVVSPSDEFVNNYTDYQSNTDRDFKATDNYKTKLDRTYGNLDIIDLYKRLPRSIFDDIIDVIKWNFIIIERSDY